MRHSLFAALSVVIALLTMIEPAQAQATANAVTSAQDAFGSTEGDESVGIYDQTSVRGFNLEAAGNYRINGRYFVKNSGVSSFFLERTTVRIGYNALTLDYPGPSGVVDYKLRDPKRGEPNQLTVGVDSYEQPFTELHIKHRNARESFSASVGASTRFRTADEQGGGGRDVLLAGTFRVDPVERVRLQVFGGEYRYERNARFRIALAPDAESLPAEITRGRYLGQQWAEDDAARRILGTLGDADLGGGWSARAIAVLSQEDPTRKLTQLFSDVGAGRHAQSSIIVSPPQRSTAYSSELRLGKVFRRGPVTHSVAVSGRWRDSASRFGGEHAVEVGATVLGEPPRRVEPPDMGGRRATLHDRIEQKGLGISYQAAFYDRFKVNGGILYSDYAKRFTDDAGATTSNDSAAWLYNFTAAVAIADGLEVYGSYSRGLEEAGTAPPTAANANGVLEATLATQRELGLRHVFDHDLTLILAGFDTRKPQVGIDLRTGAFGFVGDVAHRGIETSLSGAVTPQVSAVIGAVYTDPQVSGRDVDAGLIGDRPVGVPSWRAISSLNYQTTPRLSFDLGVEYIGAHAARSRLGARATQLRLPRRTIVDVGARYRIEAGRYPIIVRAQLLNALDTFAWRTAPGETLDYVPQRSVRVLLTIEF